MGSRLTTAGNRGEEHALADKMQHLQMGNMWGKAWIKGVNSGY